MDPKLSSTFTGSLPEESHLRLSGTRNLVIGMSDYTVDALPPKIQDLQSRASSEGRPVGRPPAKAPGSRLSLLSQQSKGMAVLKTEAAAALQREKQNQTSQMPQTAGVPGGGALADAYGALAGAGPANRTAQPFHATTTDRSDSKSLGREHAAIDTLRAGEGSVALAARASGGPAVGHRGSEVFPAVS